jgi:hypothetical protein
MGACKQSTVQNREHNSQNAPVNPPRNDYNPDKIE